MLNGMLQKHVNLMLEHRCAGLHGLRDGGIENSKISG